MRSATQPVGLSTLGLLVPAEPDLVRQVARRLTDAIMGGRPLARAKLAEAAVAREHGISRAPAIQASRRLDDASRAALGAPARAVEEDHRFHRLICEIAGDGRMPKPFDGLASEMRVVIGRPYDDPQVLARIHEPTLAAIEGGHPERVVARVDHHVGVAWREVGALVRSLPLSPTGPVP